MKFKLTNNTKIVDGITLYQIEAITDSMTQHSVNIGDLGGYVEAEYNLSQEGNCWISDCSMVYGNAMVKDDALLDFNSVVFGNSLIRGSAYISNSIIGGNTMVEGSVQIESSDVRSDTLIFGTAYILNTTLVCENETSDDHIENKKTTNKQEIYHGYNHVPKKNSNPYRKCTPGSRVYHLTVNNELFIAHPVY